MNEGDDLLAAIRQFVAELHIPVEQREAITILVGRTVVTIMSDPRFFNHLIPVQRLQAENAALRQHLLMMQVPMAAPRKAAARKRAPARKAPAKKVVRKSPPIRVKGSTPANRRAFKQGYNG